MSLNHDRRETEKNKSNRVSLCVGVSVCVYVCISQAITEECNRQAITITFNQGSRSLPTVYTDVQNSVLRLCLKLVCKNVMGKMCGASAKYLVKIKANDYQTEDQEIKAS